MPAARQPVVPSLSLSSGDAATAMMHRRRGPSFFEAIFLLLDVRFERYLTPWIIRDDHERLARFDAMHKRQRITLDLLNADLSHGGYCTIVRSRKEGNALLR